MTDTLIKLAERQAAMDAKLVDIYETLKRVDESIRGNGKEGLKARVGSLEEWRTDTNGDVKKLPALTDRIINIEKWRDELADEIKWLRRSILLCGLGIFADALIRVLF